MSRRAFSIPLYKGSLTHWVRLLSFSNRHALAMAKRNTYDLGSLHKAVQKRQI